MRVLFIYRNRKKQRISELDVFHLSGKLSSHTQLPALNLQIQSTLIEGKVSSSWVKFYNSVTNVMDSAGWLQVFLPK